MKNENKGFTLVEIIAVIALLAIVTTIVAVNMTGVNTNTEDIEIKRFQDKITSAGCQYIDKALINSDDRLNLSSSTNCAINNSLKTRDSCKNNSSGCYVCLNILIQDGFIDKDTIEPVSNKRLSELSTSEINKYKVLIKWKSYSDGSKGKECTFVGT